MLYQRKISGSEVLATRLELQLRHSRQALVGIQAAGVIAVLVVLWFQLPRTVLLGWAAGMFTLLLGYSEQISGALLKERYRERPRRVYLTLVFGVMVIGVAWLGSVYWVEPRISHEAFYLVLLVITVVSVATIAVSSVLREICVVQLFATLIPLAAWLGWHFDRGPFHLVTAALLTAIAILMTLVAGRISESFAELVESNLEREAMTRDLADLSESLRLRNLQLNEARKQLADIATIDELTGLRNRRGANQLFEAEISRAKRAGLALSVIMLDVDHFKLYNDRYGHPAGDLVLQKLSEVLLSVTARAGELAVRMGGEEFMLVLPGTTHADAMGTAEVVRSRIADLRIPHEDSPTAGVVTVSLGVVSCVPRMETESTDLVEAADKALYESKRSGRNRVTLSAFSP